MDVVESFSLKLKKEAAPIWGKILTHPFLKEMAEGSLPMEKFVFYFKQDYAYLIEFARCLGLAIAKEDDMNAMKSLVRRLSATLVTEAEMLEGFCSKLSIPVEELRKTELAPANLAYTRHMLNVAYSGTVGEIVASLLPCIWSYGDIGERLTRSVGLGRNPIYREWCAAYGSPEYHELVDWYRSLVDAEAREAGSSTKERMRSHFMLSTRYEYEFWDMAYHMKLWSI